MYFASADIWKVFPKSSLLLFLFWRTKVMLNTPLYSLLTTIKILERNFYPKVRDLSLKSPLSYPWQGRLDINHFERHFSLYVS